MQGETKKACQGDDSHGNPEIDRLRKEVQETKEINKKLRDLLQVEEMHTFPSVTLHVVSFIRSLCDELFSMRGDSAAMRIHHYVIL